MIPTWLRTWWVRRARDAYYEGLEQRWREAYRREEKMERRKVLDRWEKENS